MKQRKNYLNKLIGFKDKPFVKVITGMRRSGKSTILLLFQEYLLENNIKKENIIYMNFESLKYIELSNYKSLYVYLNKRITKEKCYILLDEIQNVEHWEKCVNSLLVDFDVDVYITGSNAYLLSSELSTLLSGRYVEIQMYPLSFQEYLDFNDLNEENIESKFEEYLKYGGFPAINTLEKKDDFIFSYLDDIYNSVIMKDVIERNNIKDVALLQNLTEFMSQNIGNLISPKKISDYLNSSGQKTNHVTIDNYLKMLENAFIIYKVCRYDIKGKQLLKTLAKYYIVDTGIRNSIIGYRNSDYGSILENVVYFELLRSGYKVTVGKNNDLEVDFIASNEREKIYIQVSSTIKEKSVLERELKPLINTFDNHTKWIITSDNVFLNSTDGIKYINIIDFLLHRHSDIHS